MFFWLDVGVIFDSVSGHLDTLLNLLIRILSGKDDRFSFNDFVFTINEIGFGSNELVENCGLFNYFLSDG